MDRAVAGSAGGDGVEWRCVETGLDSQEILERLAKRSRSGKLPGFRRLERGESGADRFSVSAFGGVYDYDLIGSIAPREDGSRLTFEMRLLLKTPIVAVALLVVTVFPGLPLTHSMLSIYFSWYTIETWWWYLPLVALTVPLMWKQFTASREEAQRDALETIGKIERTING